MKRPGHLIENLGGSEPKHVAQFWTHTLLLFLESTTTSSDHSSPRDRRCWKTGHQLYSGCASIAQVILFSGGKLGRECRGAINCKRVTFHSHSWYCFICFHDTMWWKYWPFAGWIAWSQWRDYRSFSEVRIAPTIRWNGPQFCTIFGDSRADKFPNWDASPTFPAHVVKFEGHFAEALAPLMERLGPKNRNGLVGSVSNVAGEVPVSWETEMGNQTQDDRIDTGLIQDCIHVTVINPPASKIAMNCDFWTLQGWGRRFLRVGSAKVRHCQTCSIEGFEGYWRNATCVRSHVVLIHLNYPARQGQTPFKFGKTKPRIMFHPNRMVWAQHDKLVSSFSVQVGWCENSSHTEEMRAFHLRWCLVWS